MEVLNVQAYADCTKPRGSGMTTEENDNNEDEMLKRMNDELLERRSAAKAKAMEQHGASFAAIKMHLSKGEHDLARHLANSLSIGIEY